MIDSDAQAEVWEQQLSSSEEVEGVFNTVVELVVGEGARLRYVCGQQLSERSWIFGTQRAEVGRDASLGHLACIEGCIVEDGALVGTGAVMLHRSRLGAGAVLAAGSVLMEGQQVPVGYLAAGVPATVKKPLSGSSADWVSKPARHYKSHGRAFRSGLRPLD